MTSSQVRAPVAAFAHAANALALPAPAAIKATTAEETSSAGIKPAPKLGPEWKANVRTHHNG
jgi:hypothetical protein